MRCLSEPSVYRERVWGGPEGKASRLGSVILLAKSRNSSAHPNSRESGVERLPKREKELARPRGRVRRTVEDFLLNEFQSGALLGDKPEKAYFVKCDRSTMTQNDLDNGRLICLIGVAPLRPAEFVIFRIGQMTASSKQ